MRISTLLTILICGFQWGTAQTIPQSDLETKAIQYFQSHTTELGVTEDDIRDMHLVSSYQGSKSGVYHLYFSQRYSGTDIYNAVTGVHFSSEGELAYSSPRLQSNVGEKINAFQPQLEAQTAVESAAYHLGIQAPQTQKIAALSNDFDRDVLTFAGGNISARPIPARLVYQPMEDGSLRLAWDLNIDIIDNEDYLSMRVDAITGALLDEANFTVKCDFGNQHIHIGSCYEKQSGISKREIAQLPEQDHQGQYRVFPVPYENPLFGSRQLEVDPADSLASPYGWHDVTGDDQADYTITRGNNAYAFPDRSGSGSPDFDVEGGAELIFDYPFDPDAEPEQYTEASTVNLFYMVNMMHDFAYHYGFTEEAGTFQEINYGGSPGAGDPLNARAQLGTGENNAFYSGGPDGSSAGIGMYEWNSTAADQEFLEVLSPADVSGFYAVGTAEFGPAIGSDPIGGQVAIVQDGIQVSTDGCEDLTNGEEIDGKVAIIDRGECEFSQKVYNAQLEGAIAVIICNNQGNGVINMGSGNNGSLVNIPSVFLSRSDCNQLRTYAGNTLEVELKEPGEQEGPTRLDGSLDNGIIAHEYAHGISNRLTGGPTVANCLGNDEQMGEGWSDFFTLALSVSPDDQPETPRGIGNYVIQEDLYGRGIRNFPYSTDMEVNPQTYEDVILTTGPHALGEIWNTMLWDLFWAMVDQHGYDEDLFQGDGGNNRAVQLVMEGMALQACNPGFVDGRDAILAADRLLYGGENQCLIWEVFARRGLGASADQGSSSTRRDALEAYDVPISCRSEVVLEKSVTPTIERGEEIEVELRAINHTDGEQSSIAIFDRIPMGCEYIDGSANVEAEVNGQEIQFEIDTLELEEEATITYRLSSPADQASKWIEEEGFENPTEVNNSWFALDLTGSDFFELREDAGVDNSYGWFVPNTGTENDQTLFKFDGHDLQAEYPVLRFTHKYSTNPGTDAGIVEISTDRAATFHDLGEHIFREPYRGKVDYSTFAKVNQRGFWGDQSEFTTSYIDLSEYKGHSDAIIRFRFGSQAIGPAEGWTIDDVHIFDALAYNTEATLIYDSVEVTATAEGRGTIVEPDEVLNAETPVEDVKVDIYPNPARDQFYVSLPQGASEAEYVIYDLNGKTAQSGQLAEGQRIAKMNISKLSPGMYIVEVIQNDRIYTNKLIVR